MNVAASTVTRYPRCFNVLEKLHCIYKRGDSVEINTSTAVAGATLVLALLGSAYGLVVSPMQEDILQLEKKHAEDTLNHEIRLRAGEISDARTGIHLENLTESIDRLIHKIEVAE